MSSNSPQSSYASPPPQKSDYDFITNEKPKASRSVPLSGLSFRQKLLLLVGGAAIVLIVMAIVGSLFLNTGGSPNEQLREIAQQQNELIRVAEIGTKKARDSTTLNLATTTRATLESDQRAVIAYLGGQKIKMSAKDLGLNKNTKTDDLLTRAEQSNQFDEVFNETLKRDLKKYQTAVKEAYDKASGKKAKALLADLYNHINTLLGVR